MGETQALAPGFDAPMPAPAGRTAALTARNNAAIARGRHPFGAPLANNGRTCGDCAFAFARGTSRHRYWKCSRTPATHSATTDLRLSWPACTSFEEVAG